MKVMIALKTKNSTKPKVVSVENLHFMLNYLGLDFIETLPDDENIIKIYYLMFYLFRNSIGDQNQLKQTKIELTFQ